MASVGVSHIAASSQQSGQYRIDAPLLRSNTYTVLASLLHGPPGPALVDHLSSLSVADGDAPGAMGRAWTNLREAVRHADVTELGHEYQDLFIGLGRGEVVPYGSWHLTGFLMEKPLSDLRDDLAALGIVREESEKDPEDHVAALCECMALLIQADDVDEDMERRFYACHVNPWAGKFFKELQSAPSAKFYRDVGFLGQTFMELEGHYLNLRTH